MCCTCQRTLLNIERFNILVRRKTFFELLWEQATTHSHPTDPWTPWIGKMVQFHSAMIWDRFSDPVILGQEEWQQLIKDGHVRPLYR